MSLPPGFLDELRTRLSIKDVVGRKVTWDNKKSNPGKGDMWAPCPFHQEKTASFHVDDQKGYYYCFGCQAKGDAISFVKETENASFMEAVEILAGEAGMPVPKRDPQAQEQYDKRAELLKVTEAANRFYRMSLAQSAGSEARAYLDRRQMSEEMRQRFEIGFAPGGNALMRHLKEQGISEELAIDAGVVARPDDGRSPYDFFRDRIMFPIRDGRGDLLSFGGRAMDPNARAKYLNGRETQLFDKGRALYNQKEARAACGRGHKLVVAEGYMDVIALASAGFEGAVAPLGTAITDGQLQLCWRMSHEPIIALDGDKAGLRAAHRVIELAMPLLQSGNSLRFAMMPTGKDPDDLIREGGKSAVADLLDNAMAMVTLLWERETEGQNFDSPERRAMLDKTLRAAIAPIQDRSIKMHYGEILKDLRFELFRAKRASSNTGASSQWRKGGRPAGASAATKASLLVNTGAREADEMREAVIFAVLIMNPNLIDTFVVELEGFEPRLPDHRAMHDVLMGLVGPLTAQDVKAQIAEKLGSMGLDKLFAHPHVQITPAVRRPDDELAQMCLREEFTKLKAARGYDAEIDNSLNALLADDDEHVTHRLRDAAEARNKAIRAEAEDRTEFDTAENGLELSRAERDAFRKLMGTLDSGTAEGHKK